MFAVVHVNSKRKDALEPLGTKRKFWYRDGERRMLFKAEERGTGEDWAEKVACELCALLGLPHVHYELAVESGSKKPGVVCENCAPRPVELVLGNQLLLERAPDYPADERKYKVRQHTVEAVAQIVGAMQPPSAPWDAALPGGIQSALDVFTGYVMLDAWIANQDRHHENWGALRVDDVLHLAPTFDHGSSMARNLSDEDRQVRLRSRDRRRQVPHFARRATSAFYETVEAARAMSTVAAWRAFADIVPDASSVWLERLKGIDERAVKALLAETPPHRMSRICRDFTLQLLAENKTRLLAGDEE